jgi:hypothetical protein
MCQKAVLSGLGIALVLLGVGSAMMAQVLPPGENLYCGPGDSSSFGPLDGPATLPQSCYYTALSGTISGGNVFTATSTSGLVKLLSTAKCGDVIQLTAGSTFGTFTVPAKGCDANHYITIRTSAPDSSLPAEGTRITPCYAGVTSLPGRPAYSCPDSTNVMAKVSTSTKGRDIGFASGANYYRFIGLELARNVGIGTVGTLVSTNGASYVIFDRVWAHGTAADTTNVGFSLDTSSFIAIIDSYLNDFHCSSSVSCSDSKAIGGGHTDTTSEGTWKIVNNFVEGAAEDVGFGIGGFSTVFAPADIEIRHNYFYKPTAWMPGDPNYNGLSFVVRDHLEFKNATRVLLESNVMQNSWGGYGVQQGSAIILSPRITGTLSSCPNCFVTNITIRFNTGSHVPQALALTSPGNTVEKYASGNNDFSIHDNVFDDLNYSGCYKCAGTYTNQMFGLINANLPPANDVLHDVTLNHLTEVISGPSAAGFLDLGGPTAANPPQQSNIVMTNSIYNAGNIVVTNSGGGSSVNCAAVSSGSPKANFDACWSPYTFSANVVVGGIANSSWVWPSGNFFPATTDLVNFVNLNGGVGGDYHLAASSPYKGVGNDGQDPGANIDTVNSYVAGTLDGVWVYANDLQKGARNSRTNGAGDRDRTGDIQLGKLAFYR